MALLTKNCNALFFVRSKKWDPRVETFREIRSPKPGTHIEGGTRNPRPRTFILCGNEFTRPEVIKSDPGPWDPYHRLEPRPRAIISINLKQSPFCWLAIFRVFKWEVFHERNQLVFSFYFFIILGSLEVWRNYQIKLICRFALRIKNYLQFSLFFSSCNIKELIFTNFIQE